MNRSAHGGYSVKHPDALRSALAVHPGAPAMRVRRRHASSYTSPLGRGFSLLELVVVLTILVILGGIAGMAVQRGIRASDAKGGVRRVMAAIDEARSAALLLASAGGTARVDNTGNCLAEMDASGGLTPPWGQSAVVIEPGLTGSSCALSPCDHITYVTLVQRDSTSNPPTYSIGCRVLELTTNESTLPGATGQEIIHNLTIPAATIAMTQSSGGRYFISFDSRGLVNNLPSGDNAAKFGLVDTYSSFNDGIVVLGSGSPCRDAAPGNTTPPFACATN
jgi:prepilin-type N-terminal cleavage/methylation domain-containing protein